MRLNADQLQIIRNVVLSAAGDSASTWLFGSRLDDARRGGDVDLLVQSTPRLALLQRARIKTQLEAQLGLPVDIVAADLTDNQPPFVRIALAQGIKL